jgi:hypothetical protein
LPLTAAKRNTWGVAVAAGAVRTIRDGQTAALGPRLARRYVGREHLGSSYPRRIYPGYGNGYMLPRGYAGICLPGTADDRHEQLIPADRRDRRPAATAAATGPWPSPCATFAASVAAMPSRAATARAPERPHRDESSMTTEPGVDQPVLRQRHEPTYPSCLAMRPHQCIGVFVGREHGDRLRHAFSGTMNRKRER